jgi:hypothetical protein
MNLIPRPLRYLSIVGLSLALAACDTPPTLVDQQFGLAVRSAQTQQRLLAPGAPQTDREIDGTSALGAVTRYQESFQTPPAPVTVFNIGVGAVSAP